MAQVKKAEQKPYRLVLTFVFLETKNQLNRFSLYLRIFAPLENR